MIIINKKQHILLLISLFVPLITGCEEEGGEDMIIGTWTTSSLEKFDNLLCTGSLEPVYFFEYSESYTFSEDRFTWSQTIGNSDPRIEEGSYTVVDSVYKLVGEGQVHGKDRVGKLMSETSMVIKLQLDAIPDDENLKDTCFKLTFDKID